MKRNNRGFTLVELIVSIAILGIIAVAVSSFLLAGTRSYTKVNYAVRLQYETQLAMNQIQSYVMNCSRGIAWDGSKLYVDGSGTDDTALKEISYDAANKKLLLGSGTASEAGIQTTALNLMAEHVSFVGASQSDKDAVSNSVTAASALSADDYGSADACRVYPVLIDGTYNRGENTDTYTAYPASYLSSQNYQWQKNTYRYYYGQYISGGWVNYSDPGYNTSSITVEDNMPRSIQMILPSRTRMLPG